ncbi:MAG: DUF3500 domain-containing protein [Saprospiraceae bacterium]|nr:DUF3500 domain-containing protein [Saprospiraceae bacterium]
MKSILLWLFLPLAITAQNAPSYTEKASAFIESLTEVQQKAALFPFEEMNRYDWHYFPPTLFPRTGLCIKDLSQSSKESFYRFLEVFLSPEGFSKTQEIMSYEYLLKEMEPNNVHRVPENYFVSIYGTPSDQGAWAWKFTGHHLALNFTVVDGQMAFAPFLLGANPAEIKSGPNKGKQLLKYEESLGFDLVHSMSKKQLETAVFSARAFTDIVTTNAQEVTRLQPVGILAKELKKEQKLLLNQLIAVYLNTMPAHVAQARMSRIVQENFDDIRFGWAGATEPGKPHYYRIQGKSFLIEFDNTQNNANHIHTVWRDFNGDYGRDLLKDHYQHSGHHKH